MCGIAGFVSSRRSDPAALEVLNRMTAKIDYRGPDGVGIWNDEHAFLGHRRLSIVDRAGGHQPMSNEDHSLWITYNGEIFNHARLRPQLEAAGHTYRSRSDTETLIHAYEQYGPESVSNYRGMFAYAIWDQKSRSLFAVRDRLGIKPFYYYFDGQVFVFGSEIKAVLEHPAVPCRPAVDTLGEYLAFGYLSGATTMFEGICALPPGHWLKLHLTPNGLDLQVTPYWDPPVESAQPALSQSDALRELQSRLEETVELRLMSDVPLGVFLSGGVDSSLISCLVRRFAQGPVKTFSVGYSEHAYSELDYARQTARALQTEHHEVSISATDFFDTLPKLVWHEDEPIAWPSSVPLYFVSRLARQHVVVVLTGEGADELFAGYQRYRHFSQAQRHWNAYRRVPAPLRNLVRLGIEEFPALPAGLRRKLGHTVLGRDGAIESLYLDNYYGAFSAAEINNLLPSAHSAPYAAYMQYFNKHPQSSLLQRLLYADQKTYLVELLRKQDRMSMATSIESRVPFLDHQFVAFVSSLRDELKLGPGGVNKFLLKEAAASLIPPEIIQRKKLGFPTPISEWLRGPYRRPVEQLLTTPSGFVSSVLNPAAVSKLLASTGTHDTTDRVWRLLNLELWGRRFFLNQPTVIRP